MPLESPENVLEEIGYYDLTTGGVHMPDFCTPCFCSIIVVLEVKVCQLQGQGVNIVNFCHQSVYGRTGYRYIIFGKLTFAKYCRILFIDLACIRKFAPTHLYKDKF